MSIENATSNNVVTKDQYNRLYTFIVKKLEIELPSYLGYHNLQHTLSVLDALEHLIIEEEVAEEHTWLLLTAGLLHDVGFTKVYKEHEEESCAIAKEILPEFGYSTDNIQKIEALIMVTKLPQQPSNHLEQIMCDADLYYLGAEDFFPTAENLYHEFKHEGIVNSYEEWQSVQIRFLENHRFFTKTALKERNQRKQQYIQQLQLKYKTDKKKSRFSDHTEENLKDAFFIILGVLIAAFALRVFFKNYGIFDGGITGLSLLTSAIAGLPLEPILLLLNLPFVFMGYRTINKRFAIKTFVSICLLIACYAWLPFPKDMFTEEKIIVQGKEVLVGGKVLIAIFGGFFLGVGTGLCMRAGCALDGIEVLALKTFKKTPFTVTEVTLALNILIFIIASFHVGPKEALYSILTYFTATKTIDFVVEGIEAYTGVTIISGQSDLIKYRLVNELGRGITVYKGKRGFLPGHFETSADCDIIFTVVTRLELRKLKNLVHETDAKAFVFASTIREASGGILRRRAAH